MLTNAVQDLLEESFAVQNAMQAMFAEMRALMNWNIFCDEYGIDVYTGQKWCNLYYTGGGGSGGIAGLLTGSAHDWGNFIGIFDTFRDSNMIFRGWFYGKR